MAMDLVEFLRIRAEKYNKRVPLFGKDPPISYRAFDEMTHRIACGLERRGVSRGDHVAVIHPNSPQVLLGYYSIIKAGGVAVPINTI